LRSIVESLRMAGSVEQIRDLTLNPNPDGNIFDFDLSHEEDETMEAKHLKIFWMLQNLFTEDELSGLAEKSKEFKHDPILEPILRKHFTTDEDFAFIIDFSVRFLSIRNYNIFNFGAHKTNACGVPLFASFFNHSCDPNVARASIFGNNVATVVMKPVKKGEQLFVSFESKILIYNEPSTEKRQQKILQNYRFKCSCFACANNFNLQTTLNFSRCDRNFNPSAIKCPNNFRDVLMEFKNNCKYIKKNFKHFPSVELHAMLSLNFALLMVLAESCAWPRVVNSNFIPSLSY
jgi:hypothetical protein